jgi:hypothetical protein
MSVFRGQMSMLCLGMGRATCTRMTHTYAHARTRRKGALHDDVEVEKVMQKYLQDPVAG